MLTGEQEKILRTARAAIDEFLPSIQDNTKKINDYASVILEWIPGTAEKPVQYSIGDLRTENGFPYKCTVPHTHSGETGWNPSAGTALWRRYHGTTPDMAWEFAADGANPYMTGEYCIYGGTIKRCNRDNVVHSPVELPAAWDDVE